MGLAPLGLYDVVGELPHDDRPVLVQSLAGFVDAGSAVQLARDHLLAAFGARLIVRFDLDQLFDYRARRPIMQFSEDHWESYDDPVLGLYHLRDDAVVGFLLLAGPELDLQWEQFMAAVMGLVERLGVRLTVGFTAIPMAVPQTRPVGITAHATRR